MICYRLEDAEEILQSRQGENGANRNEQIVARTANDGQVCGGFCFTVIIHLKVISARMWCVSAKTNENLFCTFTVVQLCPKQLNVEAICHKMVSACTTDEPIN